MIQTVISHMGPANHVKPKMLVPSLFSRLVRIRQVPHLSLYFAIVPFSLTSPKPSQHLKYLKEFFFCPSVELEFIPLCTSDAIPH